LNELLSQEQKHAVDHKHGRGGPDRVEQSVDTLLVIIHGIHEQPWADDEIGFTTVSFMAQRSGAKNGVPWIPVDYAVWVSVPPSTCFPS
jgi:hypothetical protein